jgi:hypothetical protein
MPAGWGTPYAIHQQPDAGVPNTSDQGGEPDDTAAGPQAGPDAGPGAANTGPGTGTGGGTTNPGTGTGGGPGNTDVDAGATGTDPGTGTGAEVGVTSMAFSVLTVSQGGRYSPDNIGAIWVENSSGQWVKTLAVWALLRQRYLSKWSSVSGSNKTDAITSATLRNHQTHNVSWNLKDASGNAVPPGEYTVWVEVTDHNGAGATTSASFSVGSAPFSSTPPNQTYYTNMSINVQ